VAGESAPTQTPAPPSRPGDTPLAPIPPSLPAKTLYRRLAGVAFRHWPAAAPALIITIAAQVVTLASLSLQGLGIDILRAWVDTSAPAVHWPRGIHPPDGWSLEARLAAVGAIVLLLSLLTAAGRFGQRISDEHFVQVCVVDLRTRLYEKLQRLSWRYFDTHTTGEIIQKLTSDTQAVRSFIQGVMIRLLIAVVTFAVFLVFMLRENLLLTAICLVAFPLQIWVMARFGRLSKPAYLHQSSLMDKFVHHFQESIAGVRVVRTFGREDDRVRGTDARSAAARDQRIDLARLRSTHIPFVVGAGIVGQGLLLLVGGWLVLKGPAAGGIALGTLWVFRGILDRLGGQAEAIANIVAGAPESLAGAERVFLLLDEPEDIADPARPSVAPAAPMRGAVEFKDVTFSHRAGVPILRSISLSVAAGETIAIVGPTGSGKSTLLSLIARFYDPDSGAVLIDGVDLRAWPLESLRKSIGFVFQDPFLFSNTIRQNVAFGRLDAEDDVVHWALDAASAHDVVAERPEGLDTIVGERGVSLSGGQRQRLTIARAIAVDPRILILDDATGAVDPITEARIQNALARKGERTTFIVAHRLSTLRRADRIVVLDHGRIVDVGSHAQLLERPGHYRASALIQLAIDDADDATADTPAPAHAGERGGAP